ncbi:MAG: cell division protein FtsZ [Candidatus Marinimicrobia bacterium]|nr:cell division protein FtsZ [Candidatus Neomarinimicrobiota bacterium]
MLFEPIDLKDQKARIAVVGVGGGGGNALNRMIEDNLSGVEFIAINTDAQDLDANNSQIKVQIGKELTKGLGAGANAEMGKQAADESKDAIAEKLKGMDMVFITAGMGGGTGTGAAPAIARIAKDCGALTVGVVTKPFIFEGPKRTKRADEGIRELKKSCDTLLVIPNETLLSIADVSTTVKQSFKLADSILNQATKGISDLINVPGLINLDFADVRTVMENMGDAIMGTGIAQGEERAILAAQQAIHSPLLQDVHIQGAKGLLVNISGPEDMTIHELNDASGIIYEEAGNDANIILGCVMDDSLVDEIRVTVIATGLNSTNLYEQEEPYYIQNMDSKSSAPREMRTRENEAEIISSIPVHLKKQMENEPGGVNASRPDEEQPVQIFGEDLDVPAFIRNRKMY